MEQFERLQSIDVNHNQLLMAGKTAHQIKHIAGRLPCYVYDKALISQRIQSLRAHLPERLHIHYAMKANPMAALVSYMAPLVDGLDVASHLELKTALASGMCPRRISFAGPAKSEIELTAAVASGVVIHAESALELLRIEQIAKTLNCKANVAIRVNPDFEVKGAGMKMSGGAKPFGIDAESCSQVISNIDERHINFVGLHLFSGSQNLNAESLLQTIQQTLNLAADISYQSQREMQQVNIGGGLGIPYFAKDTGIDLANFGQQLADILNNLAKPLQNSQIHMELGRYLVGEAGYYLCEVTDVKQSRGKTFVLTNGGMHHHLANSGNFGQVIRRNYPLIIANKVTDEALCKVEICGPLCTPLDIVASNYYLPKVEVGDIIAVMQSGAYGATASPQQFLSQPTVEELLL